MKKISPVGGEVPWWENSWKRSFFALNKTGKDGRKTRVVIMKTMEWYVRKELKK